MKSAILRAFGRGSQAAPWDNEESIREELFSIERLEEHAESLAAAQYITARPTPRRSLAIRLRDNEAVRSEEHTSELQSRPHLVCRLLLEKKKKRAHSHRIACPCNW